MKYLLSLLIFLVISCGGPPTGNDGVDNLVSDICGRYHALCISSELKEDLGPLGDLYLEGFHWGRSTYGEFDIAGQVVDIGFVCYNATICAEDLDRCGFILLHEIGHREVGSSQIAADCWAAEHSTPEQYASGVELICNNPDLYSRSRCAALRGECAQ